MSEIHISVAMTFTTDEPSTDEQFEAFLDEVMNQMDNIEREVNLGARLSDRFADFAAAVEANDFTTATTVFLGDLRTALHAAGCNTADWPKFEAGDHVVRELEDA